jgi:hypothetical protein
MPATLKPIQILSARRLQCNDGRWFEFTPEDLGRMAAAFSGAPCVPGHPPDDQPVGAYAEAVEVNGNVLQVSKYRDVEPIFAAFVNRTAAKRVSVKLRLPTHPENQAGTYLIRHIGFLDTPADTSLAPAEFAACDEHEVILSAHQDSPTENGEMLASGGGATAAAFSSASRPNPTGVPMTTTPPPAPADQAQADADFARQQAEFERQQAEFADQQAQFARAQAISPWLEEQIQKGRLLPGEKAGFVALFSRMDDGFEIEFSQGGEATKQSVAAFLKSFIGNLPERGPKLGGELAADDGDANLEAAKETPEDKTRKATSEMYRKARQR